MDFDSEIDEYFKFGGFFQEISLLRKYQKDYSRDSSGFNESMMKKQEKKVDIMISKINEMGK